MNYKQAVAVIAEEIDTSCLTPRVAEAFEVIQEEVEDQAGCFRISNKKYVEKHQECERLKADLVRALADDEWPVRYDKNPAFKYWMSLALSSHAWTDGKRKEQQPTAPNVTLTTAPEPTRALGVTLDEAIRIAHEQKSAFAAVWYAEAAKQQAAAPTVAEQRAWELYRGEMAGENGCWDDESGDAREKIVRWAFESTGVFAKVAAEVAEADAQNAEGRGEG